MSSSEGRRSAHAARSVASLALVVALAGCGFHLRGDVKYAFSSAYVNAPAASPMATELKRTLEGGGTTITEAAKDAQVTIDLANVADSKDVLSLSGGGRVREYALAKRATVAVHDGEGRDWMPAAEIVVRRSYSYNESEVLAREAQEVKLYKEMQTDVVQQIVRRLQNAKKPE
jgi:LPS-assembly lipoprotein